MSADQGKFTLIQMPTHLHLDTKRLVRDFAEELARKLEVAEIKYGYSNGWLTQDWEAECRQHLLDHLAKGDPRDVAIYAAFMWKRGWSTATEIECDQCGGSGFDTPGTGYGNVCGKCGGQKYLRAESASASTVGQ